MKWYSDYAAQRSRQVFADVISLALIGAWVWLGFTIHALVMNLSDFGVQMEESGKGFRDTMTDISGKLAEVWLIGDGIKAPFDAASDAGKTLQEAGVAQQEAVEQLATGLGFGIPVLPIIMILVLWLVPRFRFALRAGTASKLVRQGASVDLLALRALASQKVTDLAAISPDTAGAWRRSEPEVLRALAALELRSSGVRLRD